MLNHIYINFYSTVSTNIAFKMVATEETSTKRPCKFSYGLILLNQKKKQKTKNLYGSQKYWAHSPLRNDPHALFDGTRVPRRSPLILVCK